MIFNEIPPFYSPTFTSFSNVSSLHCTSAPTQKCAWYEILRWLLLPFQFKTSAYRFRISDLLSPPEDVAVFFCYTYNPAELSFRHIVQVLKKSLAQTLVTYYVFAGELVRNNAGEPELLCNNGGGVDFVEAFADVQMEDLNLYNPEESVQGKLVPSRNRDVLAVQVSQLKERGVVVASTFAHQVADAYSANMFLISWTEMARSKALSQPPSFCRTRKENRRSKVEAFCAFLWKTMVSGKVYGRDNCCKMGIVVNGRKRMIDEDEKKSNLMASYFGNVL
ncbi:hypothetical protein ACS0TY_017254 [Phlomoides rotata]